MESDKIIFGYKILVIVVCVLVSILSLASIIILPSIDPSQLNSEFNLMVNGLIRGHKTLWYTTIAPAIGFGVYYVMQIAVVTATSLVKDY